jgi:RNA-directed DNA polymerase
MDKITSTELGTKEYILTCVDTKVGISPGLAQLRQKLGEKARKEPRFRFYSLYGHIYHIETLRSAWKLIRKNGQTPGIDGLTYSDIEGCGGIEDLQLAILTKEKNVESFLLETQQELKARTYKPKPVRRVYIPKSDGKMRPLGIPTIKDRLVQMATLLIIEPIFEADFLDCSYGFRPDRSAHDAVRGIMQNLKAGRTAIYDADLKGYFDSIPHDKLLQCIKMRITDGTLLKLIESWLKAPIIETKKNDKGKWTIKVSKSSRGCPQGGVISPLLSNIYLHWFDKRFHERNGPHSFANARLVRYCDDFVVMARYVGGRLKGTVEYLLEEWLDLEINKDKTKTVELSSIGESIDFVGFTFRVERSQYNTGSYIRVEPKKKSVEKAREKIRELTSSSMSYLPVKELIKQLNYFLCGWGSYFQIGHPDRVFRKIDHWVRKKVEQNLNRRGQRRFKKPNGLTWYAYIQRAGLVSLSRKS